MEAVGMEAPSYRRHLLAVKTLSIKYLLVNFDFQNHNIK
jgi:DNA-binding transcriptional MocR family regulator